MNLLLVGTNHRIANIAVRERLTTCVGQAAGWLAAPRDGGSTIAELMVVATCHRVELYAATNDLVAAEAALIELTGGEQGSLFETDTPRYVLSGEDAVRHLCRVACGLDSVIVGEAEISGQVRRAASLGREAGTLGPYLERLAAAALGASGRARAETRIGAGVLSAASAGVALVGQSIGPLGAVSFLVVGAGQAGRQVLSRLARLDTGPVFIASRSEKHAREAAAESGASVAALDAIPDMLAQVDVLFTTLQAPSFIIRAEQLAGRSRRPLFIVDLSVPRAVDPAAAGMEGVTVRTVDDLGDIARASLEQRVLEIPQVEAIAHDEASRAFRQFRARAARATARGSLSFER